ncbi:hypothetical protein FACS1894109_07630 [Spirochaetia bacterium]|nr:hypothetical protein FACS1894109_07630 [Spirochaetia bacterium]
MSDRDLSAQLPDREFFPFWDDETDYNTFLYVDGNNAAADDGNPGTREKPLLLE